MSILHGAADDLPVKVNLQQVTAFSAIVDYYGCSSVTVYFYRLWMNNMDSLASIEFLRYGIEILCRLSNSYVFADQGNLEALTKRMVEIARGPIHSCGLPGLANITCEFYLLSLFMKILLILWTDAIENARQAQASQMLHNTFELIDSFYDTINGCDGRYSEAVQGVKKCTANCAHDKVGMLSAVLHQADLLQTCSTSPYHGISVMSVFDLINDIYPDWDDRLCEKECCSLWNALEHAILDQITVSLDSLDWGSLLFS